MNHQRKLLAATGFAAALTLAGCWLDGDSVARAPYEEVPNSAAVSSASFVSYILSLSATDETSEPLFLNDTLVVPADETEGPTPLT